MRIFIGIRPTDEFRAALSVLQNHLRTFGVTGRYLDPSNLHMTLAFIGEWPDDAVPLLPRVVHPFSLALSRPGVFPKAKVLWAGVDPSEPLEHLAGQVRQFLDEHEIPYDPKPFFPHITLVRKPSVPAGAALSEIRIPAASMPVKEVCLYRSQRGENGMEYTVIRSSLSGKPDSE